MARRPSKGKPESAILERTRRVMADAPADAALATEYAALAQDYRNLTTRFYKTIAISDAYQAQNKALTDELARMTMTLRRLREVALPICVHCRKVQTGDDYWQRLELFLVQHLDILFNQGLCPECRAATRESLGPRQTEKIPPQPRPGPKTAAAFPEDRVAVALRELAQRAERQGSPLADDITQAASGCAKLARRFAKTLTISDSFQSQLREVNERLELMARTDLLTGLANRWEMTAHIEAEHARYLRTGRPMAVVLGDIDYFKKINDTFGHPAGDRVLRAVAEALRSCVRREDTCARWGGEEFLVLLPETDADRAKQVAEKLRKVVENLCVESEGCRMPVTMSFGVGAFLPGLSLMTWLKLVDDALYAAKANGRNQVVLAGC